MHFNKSINTSNSDSEYYKISELHPCLTLLLLSMWFLEVSDTGMEAVLINLATNLIIMCS